MFSLPLPDDSVDIVYTRQSIEPNGGHEVEILKELYRITKEYLILIEPAYDLADEKAKKYMEHHGYVRNLYASAKELGFKIIEWDLYGISENPLNPVGIMIIEKKGISTNNFSWCCPLTKKIIRKIGNAYFSDDSLLAYPIINGVPLLLQDYAVVATKMNRIIDL